MLRFWISLWASKFFLFLYKKTGRTLDDRPGLLALKLCDDFIDRVKKPPLVIAVSGTNGKTTIANLVGDMLVLDGKRVAYNTWGANCKAGQARCLLDTVDIFNRSTKDAAVVEADELLCAETLPWMQPDYLVVTNIARDSIKRNAHQEFIFDQMSKGIALVPNAALILNGDDPVSSFLGEAFGGGQPLGNRRIYYGIADQGQECYPTNVSDFPVCPRCGVKPVFSYRHYRDIGRFRCPKCGLSSKESDYTGRTLDYGRRQVSVEERGTLFTYPLLSDTIFNSYNTLAVVALFRELGYPRERVAELLGKVRLPESRLTLETANGIRLYTYAAKGQNVSAASTVFEYLAKEPSEKELVLLLDEHYGDDPSIETITWLYETDFEYLNQDNIHRIIVAGHRYLDYRLRLQLAGIPVEKIVCLPDEAQIPDHVTTENVEAIYFLHDVYTVSKSKRIRQQVIERILGGDRHEN